MESEEAKANFRDILNSLNRKYDIILANWSDNKNFEVRLRTEIPRDNEDFNGLCDEWVDLFSNVTNTIWVKKISNTGPKIRFRKQYQCWTQGSKVVKKELLFDARRCKGTLDMKVLTDTPLTRRKNKHIRMGLNAVVKINFNHLHPVEVEQPFAFFVHNCAPQPEPVLSIFIPPPPPNPIATQVSLVKAEDNNMQQPLEVSHITQISAPQLSELSADNLLMCQPTLMYDPSQNIQIQSHHMVHPHLHNPNTHHYLH